MQSTTPASTPPSTAASTGHKSHESYDPAAVSLGQAVYCCCPKATTRSACLCGVPQSFGWRKIRRALHETSQPGGRPPVCHVPIGQRPPPSSFPSLAYLGWPSRFFVSVCRVCATIIRSPTAQNPPSLSANRRDFPG